MGYTHTHKCPCERGQRGILWRRKQNGPQSKIPHLWGWRKQPELRKLESVVPGRDHSAQSCGEPGSVDTWTLAQRANFGLLSFRTVREENLLLYRNLPGVWRLWYPSWHEVMTGNSMKLVKTGNEKITSRILVTCVLAMSDSAFLPKSFNYPKVTHATTYAYMCVHTCIYSHMPI